MRALWTKQQPNDDDTSDDDDDDDDDDLEASVVVPRTQEDWPWLWALQDASRLDGNRGFRTTGNDDELPARPAQQQQLPVEIVPGGNCT